MPNNSAAARRASARGTEFKTLFEGTHPGIHDFDSIAAALHIPLEKRQVKSVDSALIPGVDPSSAIAQQNRTRLALGLPVPGEQPLSEAKMIDEWVAMGILQL